MLLIDEAEAALAKVNRTDIPYYIFIDELEAYYGNRQIFERDLALIRDLIFTVKRFNTISTSGDNSVKVAGSLYGTAIFILLGIMLFFLFKGACDELQAISNRFLSSISVEPGALLNIREFEYIWRWLIFKRIVSDNSVKVAGSLYGTAIFILLGIMLFFLFKGALI